MENIPLRRINAMIIKRSSIVALEGSTIYNAKSNLLFYHFCPLHTIGHLIVAKASQSPRPPASPQISHPQKKWGRVIIVHLGRRLDASLRRRSTADCGFYSLNYYKASVLRNSNLALSRLLLGKPLPVHFQPLAVVAEILEN